MGIIASQEPDSWQFGQLTILADQASLALEQLIILGKEQFMADASAVESLKSGLQFCEGIERYPIPVESKEGEFIIPDRKAAIASLEKQHAKSSQPVSYGQFSDLVKTIKSTFNDCIRGCPPIEDELRKTQDRLHTLSIVYYKADIKNLQHSKSTRSLKIYG